MPTFSSDAEPGGLIVVSDDVVDAALVAAELPPAWGSNVRVDLGVPAGGGIVALLAGPGGSVTDDVLAGLPDLRAVVVTSMGWDHVDVEAAHRRGVDVTGVGPYCADEVAEHTVALVLGLLRGVTRLDTSVRAGAWDYGRIGRTVRGATLGLVGFGRVGAAVAWRAVGLGMDVVAYDPVLRPADTADPVAVAGSIAELVAASDVVSLHVPLSAETKGLVDADLLEHFRPGAYLVNVSRGEVVTEPALGVALREGRLGGAALDVLTHEPPAAEDPVLGFPRTVLTPHAAWYSPAAVERLSRDAGRATARALGLGDVAGAVAT